MRYVVNEDVKLIPVQMKVSFVRRIDDNLTAMGYADRAKFIRDAIYEALKARGIEVVPGEHMAPSRFDRVKESDSAPAVLREEPKLYGVSSSVASALKSGPVPEVSGSNEPLAPGPSHVIAAPTERRRGRPQGTGKGRNSVPGPQALAPISPKHE
jgi:hypothetical protein